MCVTIWLVLCVSPLNLGALQWSPWGPLETSPMQQHTISFTETQRRGYCRVPHLPALFFAFLTLMPALFVPFLPQYAWVIPKPDGNRNGNNLHSVSLWFRAITCGSYRLELSCLLYIGGPFSVAFSGFINFIRRWYDSAGIWPVRGLLSRIEWRLAEQTWH